VLESDRCGLGLGGSLSAGVEASADSEGWIVALGDMPLVPVEVIRDVSRAIENGAFIAAPELDGRRGHPVGFSRDLYDELVELREDVGARQVLGRHGHRVVIVPCADAGILNDVDTPLALKQLE
jgi:molybdenum cofactor cytidylyltransferase